MESQQTVKLQTIVSTKKKVRHMERKFSGRIAGCIQKIVLLTASAVTAFPFLWMVLSALKTKEDVIEKLRKKELRFYLGMACSGTIIFMGVLIYFLPI